MRALVSVLGHFGHGRDLLNGQTVKTKIITEELVRQLGAEQVLTYDTHGGLKTLLKAPFQVLSALKRSQNVIILPAHNGLRVYAPLLSFMRRFFGGRRLHYVVIGAWLPEFIRGRRSLSRALRSFDAIYSETETMRKALTSCGFDNVLVMPNCKRLSVLSEDELVYPKGTPYRLCTFSRVMREKGIETAVSVVRQVNERLGYTAYSLDIYGQVDVGQTEWFDGLQKTFPPYVRYGGEVPFERSVEVLRDYFALLFPTHFYTEGIPGTVIDAYAAGVPVISAKWESYSDVIDEGITGLGYEFDNTEQLADILAEAAGSPDVLLGMKRNCIERADDYLPQSAIGVLLERL